MFKLEYVVRNCLDRTCFTHRFYMLRQDQIHVYKLIAVTMLLNKLSVYT